MGAASAETTRGLRTVLARQGVGAQHRHAARMLTPGHPFVSPHCCPVGWDPLSLQVTVAPAQREAVLGHAHDFLRQLPDIVQHLPAAGAPWALPGFHSSEAVWRLAATTLLKQTAKFGDQLKACAANWRAVAHLATAGLGALRLLRQLSFLRLGSEGSAKLCAPKRSASNHLWLWSPTASLCSSGHMLSCGSCSERAGGRRKRSAWLFWEGGAQRMA